MQKNRRNVPYLMGGKTHDSEEACHLWRYPTEHRIARPFEATQGSSDIRNHPKHIHMQIDGTEVAALGHPA